MPEPAEVINLTPGAPVAAATTQDTTPTEVEITETRKFGLLGWFSILWLVGITLAAILAPVLPLEDPGESILEIVREGPGTDGHILGGDGLGRDLLSRVIFGARISLLIGFGSIVIGTIIGGTLGLLAGFYRGKLDAVITMFFNVLLSVPALVLAMSFAAVFASRDEDVSTTRRLVVLILALGLISVPTLGRITRASTLSWSEREFVKAAQVIGAKPRRIIWREILPNVMPAMMSIALLGMGVVIVFEGALALLGVGIQEDPTWGNIINEGRIDLSEAPWIVGMPSTAIFLTVLSLNSLGDIIRARFDVREAVL